MNNRLSVNSSIWSRTLPVAFFFFGIWYFCIRILGYELEYIPGDFADSRFINYLLEHGSNWMWGKTGSFWDAQFMYPFQNTIAISDNMIGTMPIYALFRMIGASNETAYQLWWIVICSLNYWSAYIVLKRWFNRWDLAIIGAWIFAFSIFNLGQLNYLQMTIRFMVPIAIYAGAKWVETSKTKYFTIFALALVYQFYSVIYTGFFLFYFSIGFIFLYALITKRYFFFTSIFKRSQLKLTIPVIVLSLLAMGWLMLPYYEISKILGLRLYDEVKMNIPLWQSFLYPQESAHLWHAFSKWFKPEVEAWWIHHTFPGIIPLLGILAIPFVYIFKKMKASKLSPLTLVLMITTFIIFILYIRSSGGYTLYVLLFKLPGMNSIRVINRFMHVELFFVIAMLISLLVLTPKKYSVVFMFLVLLDNTFLPEKMVRRPKSELTARREITIQEVKKYDLTGKLAFAIVDSVDYHHAVHLDAMMASSNLGVPTVNGYSSSGPTEFSEYFNTGNYEGLKSWLAHNHIPIEKILIIYRPQNSPVPKAY